MGKSSTKKLHSEYRLRRHEEIHWLRRAVSCKCYKFITNTVISSCHTQCWTRQLLVRDRRTKHQFLKFWFYQKHSDNEMVVYIILIVIVKLYSGQVNGGSAIGNIWLFLTPNDRWIWKSLVDDQRLETACSVSELKCPKANNVHGKSCQTAQMWAHIRLSVVLLHF